MYPEDVNFDPVASSDMSASGPDEKTVYAAVLGLGDAGSFPQLGGFLAVATAEPVLS
jgi:hypothetical protein